MNAKGNSQINAHPKIDKAKPATAIPFPFMRQKARGECTERGSNALCSGRWVGNIGRASPAEPT